MQRLPQNTALVIVDVQQGFHDPIWGKRNNSLAEQNIAHILRVWRSTQRPIYHIQHLSLQHGSPLRAEHPGSNFQAIVHPIEGETIIQKHVHSAFIGTNLEQQLREKQTDTLIIVGLTTNHCVSTTARMAANLGFTVYLISDATATFDRKGPDGTHYNAEDLHAISLASLHQEFATVITTQTLLAQIEA